MNMRRNNDRMLLESLVRKYGKNGVRNAINEMSYPHPVKIDDEVILDAINNVINQIHEMDWLDYCDEYDEDPNAVISDVYEMVMDELDRCGIDSINVPGARVRRHVARELKRYIELC